MPGCHDSSSNTNLFFVNNILKIVGKTSWNWSYHDKKQNADYIFSGVSLVRASRIRPKNYFFNESGNVLHQTVKLFFNCFYVHFFSCFVWIRRICRILEQQVLEFCIDYPTLLWLLFQWYTISYLEEMASLHWYVSLL